MLTLVTLSVPALTPPSGAVVFGPGSLDLRLVTAKLLARAGFQSATFSERGTERRLRNLMYGGEYADRGIDAPNCASVISEGGDIQAALQACKGVVLVADEGQLAEDTLGQALATAQKC